MLKSFRQQLVVAHQRKIMDRSEVAALDPWFNIARYPHPGIPKIRRAMQLIGSPLAEFKTDEDRIYFTVVVPIHQEARIQVTHHVTPMLREMGKIERALLEFCLTPRDRARIQTHLKIRNAKHLSEWYLKPMLGDDFVWR